MREQGQEETAVLGVQPHDGSSYSDTSMHADKKDNVGLVT